MASVTEAAQRLGVDVRTIRRWIESGELLAKKEGSPAVWVVSDEAVAAREDALLKDVAANIPAVGSALDSTQADLMSAQADVMKQLQGVISLLMKPLDLLLENVQKLLARSIEREQLATEQNLKMTQTVQEALDRTAERTRAQTEEERKADRMDKALAFVQEQIPKALKYGALAPNLEKAAPFVLAMFEDPKSIEEAREQLDPATFEGLMGILSHLRSEAAAKAARDAKTQATTTPPTEGTTTP